MYLILVLLNASDIILSIEAERTTLQSLNKKFKIKRNKANKTCFNPLQQQTIQYNRTHQDEVGQLIEL